MIRLRTFSMAMLGTGAMILATLGAVSAAEMTVSGTLVDVAQWVSNDSNTMTLNMPSIMMSNMTSSSSGMMSSSGGMVSNGSAMTPGPDSTMSAHHPVSGTQSGGSPMGMGSGMAGGMMGCHAMLGIVTSNGQLYVLLANQASPMGALTLCGRVGKQVTVTGTAFARGGVHALLVSKLPR